MGSSADISVKTSVYSIPAHRGFADALAVGLVARAGGDPAGLARTTLILPNQRAQRAIGEAFVRASGAISGGSGMLLPRMAVVGDIDLGEALGAALDPLGQATAIPPAADPLQRLLVLARLVATSGERRFASLVTGERLRIAREIAAAIDRLTVERVDPHRLFDLSVEAELQDHMRASLALFRTVFEHWRDWLAEAGQVDAAERRNRQLDHAAKTWHERPPAHPVVAAGVTTAAPAIAGLLRSIAFMPRGSVVLPDLDLALDDDIWDALGPPRFDDDQSEKVWQDRALTHPQYHLKVLLDRMGVARGEVRRWHRSGPADAPSERSRAISNLFLPPEKTPRWRTLEPRERRLDNVRLMESATPAEEAQAIAILIRDALRQPERRVALVTPDRDLAARVTAQLRRWNIMADDSAGAPLSQTPEGALLLGLADLIAEDIAPVPLLALVKHPLVQSGDGRRAWMDGVRELDLALRGPRGAPGLGAIGSQFAKMDRKGRWQDYWASAAALLAPLEALRAQGALPLGKWLEALAQQADALSEGAIWGGVGGRALARFIESTAIAPEAAFSVIEPRELARVLRDFLDEVPVRAVYGAHPRVAIYGLLEARLQQAELVICAGLNEGIWPQPPRPDALLSPRVLRELGIAPPEFRIGLSAHDLAGAMGAPEVVLSRAKRDAGGPAVASRFVLRMKAMLGDRLANDTQTVTLARALDRRLPVVAAARPAPMPSESLRRVDLSATELDRLRADPFAFYASKILRLRRLDTVDAEPSPAWRGTQIHAILERWATDHALDPAKLREAGAAFLRDAGAHPLVRVLWGPRLLEGLDWVARYTADLIAAGRTIAATEERGEIVYRGLKLHGRADRIDRLADGGVAIVDYKTGKPPSGKQVEQGFALQLGLLGLLVEQGGFGRLEGPAKGFEYWSLGKGKGSFGYVSEPIADGNRKKGLPRDEFVDKTREYLDDGLNRWLLGNEPFTAKLNPDAAGYADYDQLMRLDEWYGRALRESENHGEDDAR